MLAQQFINAISLGGVYALFAFGFTLVFGVLNVINLAHGAVFMIGAYAALHAVVQLRLPLLGGIFVAMLVTGVAGWILDKWIRRRAAAGPRCSSDRPADAQTVRRLFGDGYAGFRRSRARRDPQRGNADGRRARSEWHPTAHRLV